MGSGTTLVAAALTDRRGVGYDLDSDYVDIARERINAAHARVWAHRQPPGEQPLFLRSLKLSQKLQTKR